jgi:hypothetical protein
MPNAKLIINFSPCNLIGLLCGRVVVQNTIGNHLLCEAQNGNSAKFPWHLFYLALLLEI